LRDHLHQENLKILFLTFLTFLQKSEKVKKNKKKYFQVFLMWASVMNGHVLGTIALS